MNQELINILQEAKNYTDYALSKLDMKDSELFATINSQQLLIDNLKSSIDELTRAQGDQETDLYASSMLVNNRASQRGIAMIARGDIMVQSNAYPRQWEFQKLSPTSIKIGVGRIIRNDIVITSTATDITGMSSYGTYYMLATLATATGENPRLIPASVAVAKSSLNTLPSTDASGKVIYVLGEVKVDQSGVIEDFTQYITDEIIDPQEIPDALRHVNTDPALSTITRNPTANVHKNELCMFGSYNVILFDTTTWAYKWGIPALYKDANFSGELAWVGLDTENATGQKSLEIDGTTKWLQIYKMDRLEEAAATGMDFCARTAAGGEVFWVDWDLLLASLKTTVDVITNIKFESAGADAGWIMAEVKTLTVFAAAAGAWVRKIQAFPCETDTVTGQMVIAGVTTDVVVTGRVENP